MRLCVTCVLPENFPNIKFDKDGTCNYCNNFKGEEKLKEDKAAYFEKFKELINGLRDKGDYDCTLSYSGGKDSSYTLHVLREVFNLKVLVLTLDNGFVSEQTWKNISALTENLQADSMVFKPDFSVLKKIFRYAVSNPMYSPKTLERASTICTSCIGLVKFIFLKTAIEKRIPMMAWGWSPGQAPIRSSIMKINPALFKVTQDTIKKPMNKIAGDAINPYFLSEAQFADEAAFPYNVSPLAFMDYDENKILEKLHRLGWRSPEDVDTNSTNCLLNSLANQIHIDRYNFHPYAFEIAEMVRTGVMSRKEGLEKIAESGNDAAIRFARERLEI